MILEAEPGGINAYLPLIGIMFGIVFGGGGILYAVVMSWLNRRQNKALIDKTESETAKLKQEASVAKENFKIDRVENAADSIERLLELYQKTSTTLAEKVKQLSDAEEATNKALKTIEGKDAIIRYQQQENHTLVEINKGLKDGKEKIEEELKNLRLDFEKFKKEHEDCLKQR